MTPAPAAAVSTAAPNRNNTTSRWDIRVFSKPRSFQFCPPFWTIVAPRHWAAPAAPCAKHSKGPTYGRRNLILQGRYEDRLRPIIGRWQLVNLVNGFE
jgi:hypothetical protein